MKAEKSGWWIAGGIVAAIIIFQLFFRYQYVSFGTSQVWRVDRLTGASCDLPCSTPGNPKTPPLAAAPQGTQPPVRVVQTPVPKQPVLLPAQPNARGFWTNVEGASDGRPYTRGVIRVQGTITKGSTGVNAGFFVGDNGGTGGTGYFIYSQTNGNFAITRFLSGVSQGDVRSVRAKNDKKPHAIFLTIRTSGNTNTINATFDNLGLAGSDTTVMLPDPSYVTVYTGGAIGTLSRYSASAEGASSPRPSAASSPMNVPSKGPVNVRAVPTPPRKSSPTSSP